MSNLEQAPYISEVIKRIEANKALRNRLEDQIGFPYTDSQHGFKLKDDGSSEVWFILETKEYKNLRRNDVVVVYDLLRDLWFGGLVVATDEPASSEIDRTRMIYSDFFPTLLQKVREEDLSFLRDPGLAKIEIISIFEKGASKPVTASPTNASALLYPAMQKKVKDEPLIIEILGLRSSGLLLGYYSRDMTPYSDRLTGNHLPYYFDVNKLSNKHMLILGSSGYGKTMFLKHFILELIARKQGVLTFDLQGDIVQIACPPNEDTITAIKEDDEISLWQEAGFIDKFEEGSKPISRLPSKQVTVLIPHKEGTLPETENRAETVKDWAKSVGVDTKTIALEFQNVTAEQALVYLKNLSDRAREALKRLMQEYRGMTLPNFIQHLGDIQELSPNWIGIRGTDVRMHIQTYENLLTSIQNLRGEGIFDIADYSEPERYVEPGKLTILYLEHLPEEFRHIYEFHAVYSIYRRRMKIAKQGGASVIIDEAHEVIPTKSRASDYAEVVAGALARVARQGRKYDINLIVSTHKPLDIHPVVYDLAGTKIVFRLSPDDAKRIGIPMQYRSSVVGYSPGYALINSPENASVPWIEIKTLRPICLHEKPGTFFAKTVPADLERHRKELIPENEL